MPRQSIFKDKDGNIIMRITRPGTDNEVIEVFPIRRIEVKPKA